MNNKYDWIEFYTALADKLLQYADNRTEMVAKIIKVYEAIGMKLPTLEKNNNVKDMDPFTVFGLFNKGITNDNRVAIITGIASEFGINTVIPKNFEGIPVLNNMKATYYYFEGDRGADDIDYLWKVFASALRLASEDNESNRTDFCTYYNKVIKQAGIRWNITMGLYWIRPYFFLNLDSRNRWYMCDEEHMPSEFVGVLKKGLKEVPSAEKYLELRDECTRILSTGAYSYTTFPDLSYESWIISEKVNAEIKAAGESGNSVATVDDTPSTHYWIYSPGDNACNWEEFFKKGIMAIGWGGIGDLKAFPDKSAMKAKMKEAFGAQYTYKNAAHATWQFANEIKVGDIVFVKKGMHQIIGRGIVTGEYQFVADGVTDDYNNVRTVNWTDNGSWDHPGQAVMKTLTDITAYTDYVVKLNALFETGIKEDEDDIQVVYPPYTKSDFLDDVYMSDKAYDELVGLVKLKKNVILQGAPGVGKTFVAKRLAYSIMGVQDKSRVEMVQFHQSYSYEDFIMGYRPNGAGFEMHKGPFYEFCKKAEIDSDNEYFFIIDEINRGNLSKIFGELFMLIENDKRGMGLKLLYADEQFNVPKNVYLIGMMNTADRSLAMLDYALRRRFAFYEIVPGFTSEGFKSYQGSLDNAKFDALIEVVRALNDDIAEDESLGEGFRIGHSYFCNLNGEMLDDSVISSIIEYELIPLLKEYWFDESSKVKHWTDRLRGVLK